MKRFKIFSILGIFLLCNAQAAVPQQRRGTASATSTNTASTSTRTNAVSARSATKTARAATPTATTTTARAATTGRTTVARSATTSTASSTPVVAARAGATQKVINTGTKIAAATENTVVSDACRQKYYGCMDSFCMLDNDSGGRCICSDRNAELDSVLAEIEKLDQQSYQMATTGVERIEMGDAADAAIANATAVADSILNADEEKNNRALDLSLWNVSFDDDEDIFGDALSFENTIEGKEGDALYSAVNEVCIAQIPECASELSMLQLMYSQQIKSDCSAYENSLKQQKNASAQKLAAAEKALRDAALDQYRNANKYDLGQCTVEFKSCMITTGGCGEDFSQCATVMAIDNTTANSRKAKSYKIKGEVAEIEISASTYDTLIAKKPLCESITKNCVSVADQVWDTFLKEVAPQLKSAELIAEDNARQNCIGSISDCFQKACKDNIDPNDPDGSYDMCLTRPETMLNLCKIPLNACGIDASSAEKAEEEPIWEYVVARLASMRVDSCTTAVKECLQSEDMCGADYTQCIGLDTDTIIRMCPAEKLVGCQQEYGDSNITENEDIYNELANMVQGIMLNIDNSFLTECQNAVDESMIKVCGDTESCNGLIIDDGLGGNSLEYKICEYTSGDGLTINYNNCVKDVAQIPDSSLGLGGGEAKKYAVVIDGTIDWTRLSFNDEGNIEMDVTSLVDTLAKLNPNVNIAPKIAFDGQNVPKMSVMPQLSGFLNTTVNNANSSKQQDAVSSELSLLQRNINSIIDTIEADPTVQFCMTGRTVQGMTTSDGNGGTRNVINRGDTTKGRFENITVQTNYIIGTAALKKARDNYNKRYAELEEKMAQDYVKLEERMAEIEGENALEARRDAAQISCVGYASSSVLPSSPTRDSDGYIYYDTNTATGTSMELVGSQSSEQWNYKETVTSTFNKETLVCHRCVRAQNCEEKGYKKNCKVWGDPVETCTDIQF